MAKPAVSRDAFRSFFALYAAKAHHDNKPEGEHRLMKLFGSSENIPDDLLDLLDLWSARADSLGPETISGVLCPRARDIANGSVSYDHASDFLHALLRELDQRRH